METTRQQKISRLIQKELSDIFQKDAKSMHGVIVSITKTYISPDMSVCRAYISVFPSERAEEILATGGDISAHEVMIAAEKSNLSLQMAVQIRNRLINAYTEINTMQV